MTALKAFVTGASGLLGGQICRSLTERGDEVRAGIRGRPSFALANSGVEPVAIALDDPLSLVTALTGSDVVFHCAAIYSYDRSKEVEEVNVEGTRNVILAAGRAGVRRVVVTSSSVTCGSSAGPVEVDENSIIGDEFAPAYFASKVRQEEAALDAGREHDVEVVIACPTVILGGPATRLVPSNAIVLRYLLDPWRSTFPGGCNLVSVLDVAAGHLLLADRGESGQRYLLGGENLAWRSIHRLIAELAGVGGPYLEASTTTAYLASLAAEGWAKLMATRALSSRDEALTVGRYYWYSHRRAEALGYSAGPARTAVASSLAWLLAGEEIPDYVRSGLRVHDDVRSARVLVPRAL